MRVGIFDSGVGGINVLKELIKKYPHNEYIFYGDTINLPYGSKTIDQLKEYASNIIEFLIGQKVDLIIIACGTISSNCFDYLKSKYDIPLYDIVSPTMHYIDNSPYKNIGVIATERTIESKIFEQSRKVTIAKATKNFVKIIEDGVIDKFKRVEIESELEVFKNRIDALILGCTHYPFISSIISSCLNVPLIDMGTCLAEELDISNNDEQKIDLYFSLLSSNLENNISKILTSEFNIHRLVINKKSSQTH